MRRDEGERREGSATHCPRKREERRGEKRDEILELGREKIGERRERRESPEEECDVLPAVPDPLVGIPGGDPLEQRVEFSCRQPRGSWVSRFQPDGPQITSDRGRPSQEQPQPRCDKARLKLEGAGLRLVSHISSLISLLCGPLEQRVQFCCPPPPMIKPDQGQFTGESRAKGGGMHIGCL